MKKFLLYFLYATLFVSCSETTVGYESAEEYLATVDEENKIYYKSSDGEVIPTNRATQNIKLLSNSYHSGQGVITFGQPVTEVYSGMFSNCITLTDVTLSHRVTKISDNAFSGCYYLSNIVLPDFVTTIEHNAFRGCLRLMEVTLPSRLKKIEELAFQECILLSTIYCKAETPPTGGDRMFLGASSLKIYVPRASVELYKEAPYWCDYAERIVGFDF